MVMSQETGRELEKKLKTDRMKITVIVDDLPPGNRPKFIVPYSHKVGLPFLSREVQTVIENLGLSDSEWRRGALGRYFQNGWNVDEIVTIVGSKRYKIKAKRSFHDN